MTKLFPFRLKRAASAVVLFAALLAPAPDALAQSTSAPASVAGRVTDGERGLPGVTVVILMNDPTQRFKTATRGKTDADGRYLIQNVPPGRYQIAPFAATYILSGVTDYPPGRPLTLLSGEEVKDVDFHLELGGVITGRVTDADGEPVIAEPVSVVPVEETGRPTMAAAVYDQRDMMTDDRGVYRIYGLAPGRYRVAVGRADGAGGINYARRKIFRRTFYPDATEAADARVVEVKAGQESTDVDITVGRALKTYRASGVFVSAETGQPVPDIAFAYSTVDGGGRIANLFGRGEATNARGEFRTEGLVPGRYTIFASPSGQSNSGVYSEPTPFEVTDADVTGIVVKIKRGATLSGFVTVEGTNDRAALASTLAGVRVYAWVDSTDRVSPPYTSSAPPLGADGSFTLTGLRPGKVRIGYGGQIKGLMLRRVELNGANTGGTIDVAEGAQIGGLHVVLAYGTAVITGQTSFVNGTIPPGGRAIAQARRVGGNPGEANVKTAEVDMRGYFRIDGLPAGDYEVSVIVFGGGPLRRSDSQRVTLAESGEARVSPVVDLSAGPPPPPPPPSPEP